MVKLVLVHERFLCVICLDVTNVGCGVAVAIGDKCGMVSGSKFCLDKKFV